MNSSNQQSQLMAWVESLRPKTLFLALAVIIAGSAIAYWRGFFRWDIALFTLLTAALLQILSNLANDFGDAVKGSDTAARIGPNRGMQKGLITQAQMKKALIITIFLIICSGLVLIMQACKEPGDIIGFIGLGLFSIVAAITYTIGNRPYGYIGLGDISVLLFFGWLSVVGTYYLQSSQFDWILFIPATACGLLSVAVLNINNLRDIDNDQQNGKNTLAVRLGAQRARYYHVYLLLVSALLFAYFAAFELKSVWGWLFLLMLPFFYRHACYVLQHLESIAMRPMLGQMVKIALLTNLLFAIGVILSR